MILERLYLENYKQFRDPLELEPPEGAIGVVGTNGAGKTTLFESILWAFFGPQAGGERFKNDMIPWSGGSSRDRTAVRVTLDTGGGRYTVERTLQSGRAQARVLSGMGGEILSGPREVSDWVQNHLLGMDQKAFESTFFARQKELEFFSGVTGISRQREVARLLGISRIERARELLNEERRKVRERAEFLEARLAGRDREGLEGELAAVREEKVELQLRLAAARKEHEAASSELATARQERERLEELYREHNRLSSELREARAGEQRAADRAQALRERLRELDEAERELERLRPALERLPRVGRELKRLDETRRQIEDRERAKRELGRARRRAAEAVVRSSRLLEDLDGFGEEPLPGWAAVLRIEDETEQMHEAVRVLRHAPDALRAAEERLHRLKDLGRRHAELEREEAGLRRAEEALAGLAEDLSAVEEEIREVSGGEDLEALSERLRGRKEDLRQKIAALEGEAAAAGREAANLDRAREIVEAAGSEGECPTCRRPFDGDDYRAVVETQKRQAKILRDRAAEALAEAGRLREEADAVSGRLRSVAGRLRELTLLKERRTQTAARLKSAEESLARDRRRVEELRAQLPAAPPAEEEIRRATDRVAWLTRLREAGAGISSCIQAFRDAEESAAELRDEIRQLADLAYDAEEHRRLEAERAHLEGVRGRVEVLRADLSRRGGIERELDEAETAGKSCRERASSLKARLAGLAFNEAEYRAAGERLRAAELQREALGERLHKLEREHTRLEHRLESVAGRLREYDADRKRADEQAARAGRLEQMNRLFKEFYVELSSRARPALEREASELVRMLTDGKYERVEFDENYGLRLFDGLSDAYGIERFSGGEADIVSLAARVSLSKMISARNSEALGFIVLDEVFGALDSDRRHNVLLALDRLKRAFGQIFIISHVVDVQESALLDEIWLVQEDGENKSRTRVLKPGKSDLERIL